MSAPTTPTDRPLISLDKKYRTKDGKAVRVLCIDAINPVYPVFALVELEPSEWTPFAYTANGQYSPIEGEYCEHDLIEDIPKQYYRVALFFNPATEEWTTKVEDDTWQCRFNENPNFVRYLTSWIEYDCTKN